MLCVRWYTKPKFSDIAELFGAIGADHDFEIPRLADPMKVMVVVGEVLLGEHEIHLGRYSGLQMYFPEAFEFYYTPGF